MSSNFDKLDKPLKATVAFMARKTYAEQTHMDDDIVDIAAISKGKPRNELDALQEQIASDPEKLAEAKALAARISRPADFLIPGPGRGRA